MNILIHTDGLKMSAALEDAIEEKIGRVEQYAPRALRARVHVRKDSAHASQDQFVVKVLIELPGKDESATVKGPDPMAALDIVSEKIEQRLRVRKTKRLSVRHQSGRVRE